MDISHKYFLDLFDEFKSTPSPKIDIYLKLAKSRVSERVWGDMWLAGVSYLAAHMMAVAASGGEAGGALTQVAVGDLSKSFSPMADNDTGDATYKTTAYGRVFLELRREVVMGFGVTGCPFPPEGTVV